ncbi:hypothetical protein [Microcoleus sp. S13C4]|uniref:hypothetical protein n=1 Tax=Microcoleus sp. S13C4 TaxID=3055410 RepID=UPI002FD3E7DA
MGNYQPKQTFKHEKFKLELYPYAAPPENRFENNAALHYGADFNMEYERSGKQTEKIGLIQLIFPQNKLFPHTNPQKWNVDNRQDPNDNSINMNPCLYSKDNILVGNHSQYYQGRYTRFLSPTKCWLIDTPREFGIPFDQTTGKFGGIANTKFANYVVQLENGKVFNNGIVWGYSFHQNDKDGSKFDVSVQDIKSCQLNKTNEHLDAIASFLKTTREVIRNYIA